MRNLKPSQAVEVPGSSGRTYVLKNTGGVYSCTCMAWRTQLVPAPERTCKHLKLFRGEQAELNRITIPASDEPDVALPRVLRQRHEVTEAIESFRSRDRLWVDTEIADWQRGNGRLSLIQVLPVGVKPHTGAAIFLDVLDQPALIARFIERIMRNRSIEKVFHNASFDLRFLGDDKAVHVHCTLKAAKSLRPSRVSLPDSLSLKALSEHFGLASSVSKAEQKSDWGQRPLTTRQLKYAALDVVYLRGVHLKLLEMQARNPVTRRPVASRR